MTGSANCAEPNSFYTEVGGIYAINDTTMSIKLSQVNFILLLAVITWLGYSAFAERRPGTFEEISTERLNVVGADGKHYVVISSPERQALATVNGEPVDPEQTERPVPGLLFFNSEGDEVGGLVFGIDSAESYQLLTFDQRKNDQVMVLRKDEYLEDGAWQRQYGLHISERGDKPSTDVLRELRQIEALTDSAARAARLDTFWADPEHLAPLRLFLGRLYNGHHGLYLLDKQNQIKLALRVDADGNPAILVADSTGKRVDLIKHLGL